MEKFVFVIGIGRSGTSLVQAILNAHSRIHFTSESHFIKRYLSKEYADENPAPHKRARLLEAISRDRELKGLCDNLSGIVKRAAESRAEGITPQIFREVLKERAGEADYLGDKDPMNVNYLRPIRRALPDSFVIHVIRDPRDVIASRMKTDWGKRRHFYTHLAEYRHGIKKARKEGRELFRERYFECRYEFLLSDSGHWARDTCAFLGLDYEEKMLEFHRAAETLFRPEEKKWKENIGRDIITGNSGKWKKELSANRVRAVEGCLAAIMDELGYERSGEGTDKISMANFVVSCIEILYKLRFG